MRFDTPIYFRSTQKGAYNAETGDYEPATLTEDKRYADITCTGVNTLKLVYGDIRQGSLTVRMQNFYDKPFESIRIGDTIYKVDTMRKMRNKQSFVVSEVQ